MSAIAIQSAVVATQAQARCSRAGEWTLFCDLRLSPAGRTSASPDEPSSLVRVPKPFGSGPAAAQACSMRARQMHPGVRVNVTAQSFRSTRERITLIGVTDLTLPDLYDHHHKVSP